ncbi:hypothetical protein [Pseudarthrobacter sp.]|uniref:hypothetical protein n=1 Tax=Pseudarthrobacter sp. TaxID=1934409 RepID=UPI002FC80E0E
MEFNSEPSGQLSMSGARLQIHELHACAYPECLGMVHDLLAEMSGESPESFRAGPGHVRNRRHRNHSQHVGHGSDEGRTLCNLILEVYPNRLNAPFRDNGLVD